MLSASAAIPPRDDCAAVTTPPSLLKHTLSTCQSELRCCMQAKPISGRVKELMSCVALPCVKLARLYLAQPLTLAQQILYFAPVGLLANLACSVHRQPCLLTPLWKGSLPACWVPCTAGVPIRSAQEAYRLVLWNPLEVACPSSCPCEMRHMFPCLPKDYQLEKSTDYSANKWEGAHAFIGTCTPAPCLADEHLVMRSSPVVACNGYCSCSAMGAARLICAYTCMQHLHIAARRSPCSRHASCLRLKVQTNRCLHIPRCSLRAVQLAKLQQPWRFAS